MRATKAVNRLLCQSSPELSNLLRAACAKPAAHSPRVKCPDVCELVWGASCPVLLSAEHVREIKNYVPTINNEQPPPPL